MVVVVEAPNVVADGLSCPKEPKPPAARGNAGGGATAVRFPKIFGDLGAAFGDVAAGGGAAVEPAAQLAAGAAALSATAPSGLRTRITRR